MKIKAAVPDNPLYSNLYLNWQNLSGSDELELYKTSEKEVSRLMLRNLVDIALVNPITYGKAINDADYRIIPGVSLSSVGFTSQLSLYFREGLRTITKCSVPIIDDFYIQIAKLLLAENYNMYPEYITSGVEDSIGENCDAALLWKQSSMSDKALDISEEWFQIYEMPLVLLFWVCRAELSINNLIDIINKIRNPELLREGEIYDEESYSNPEGRRQGRLLWQWNDELEKPLEHILQLLYYHQLLPEIPAVKILGRD